VRRAARSLTALAVVVLAAVARPGHEPSAAPAGGPRTLLAAGDIGRCDRRGDEATARILRRHPGATIAPLGDLAYPSGTERQLERCFGPSWGRFRGRMRPVAGDNEYETDRARPYARYFGRRAGRPGRLFYAYGLGAWRVVVLDSECDEAGGCGAGDPQGRLLRRELRRHRDRCTLAAWHRPPFSSTEGGGQGEDDVRSLWRIAASNGADVVLTGHEHSYERFEPMGARGVPRRRGTRLFVVGTGGTELIRFRRPPLAATAARDDDTLGVLRLMLRDGGYRWRFLPAAGGRLRDRGAAACH
jgi:alkaline phosphatase